MKFRTPFNVDEEIKFGDHAPGCEKCREVDFSNPATLSRACAMPGAPLLAEELRRRQAPVTKAKAKAVEEWAKSTGHFAEFDRGTPAHVKRLTRYVGDK